MKVIRVVPEKKAELVEIENELESLQAEVGGYIEAIYPFPDAVAIVCNEEGKLNGCKLNRALLLPNGEIYDILAGTFLIVGLGEEDFDSLTDENAEKFLKMFEKPQRFYQTNTGKIICEKY